MHVRESRAIYSSRKKKTLDVHQRVTEAKIHYILWINYPESQSWGTWGSLQSKLCIQFDCGKSFNEMK